MTNTINSVSQEFNPGALVHLYIVDLSVLGGGITRWADSSNDTSAIVFNGDTYTPLRIEADGFEWSGKGSIPTPTIRIFPTDGIKAAMIAYKDFIGAKITRIKTFSRFLDGQPDADPNQKFADEVYYFEQKTLFNKNSVEWSLSSTLDQEGVELPKKRVLKDVCELVYRVYDDSVSPASFTYTAVVDGGCPYNGASYFDVEGNSVTIDLDKCGKRLSECKRRFGSNATLPFGGFPGVTNFRR